MAMMTKATRDEYERKFYVLPHGHYNANLVAFEEWKQNELEQNELKDNEILSLILLGKYDKIRRKNFEDVYGGKWLKHIRWNEHDGSLLYGFEIFNEILSVNDERCVIYNNYEQETYRLTLQDGEPKEEVFKPKQPNKHRFNKKDIPRIFA